jgi:hypothetical protein
MLMTTPWIGAAFEPHWKKAAGLVRGKVLKR